eukprot:3938603-Rhodomonas_salina.1
MRVILRRSLFAVYRAIKQQRILLTPLLFAKARIRDPSAQAQDKAMRFSEPGNPPLWSGRSQTLLKTSKTEPLRGKQKLSQRKTNQRKTKPLSEANKSEKKEKNLSEGCVTCLHQQQPEPSDSETVYFVPHVLLLAAATTARCILVTVARGSHVGATCVVRGAGLRLRAEIVARRQRL